MEGADPILNLEHVQPWWNDGLRAVGPAPAQLAQLDGQREGDHIVIDREGVLEFGGHPAGEPKYGFLELMRLAAAGLTSFSTRPLRLAMALGFCLCLSAIGLGLFYLIKALVFDLHTAAPGFATLVVLLLFLNGTVMLLLGILGEYLAQIFLEVKRRPTYLVDRFVDLEHD